MIVKVCGMRDPDNIREVESLGIDWMGFIFYPKSARDVGAVPPSYLPVRCKRVGVMVNPTLDEIVQRQKDYGLDLVQLHGDESPRLCADTRRLLPGIPLVKMIQVTDADGLRAAVSRYEGVADYFLFETKTAGYGGSGRQFDWSVLQAYDGTVPFLLSGGIGPDDSSRVTSFSHPMFVGVDLNSRFETAPGMKDTELLGQFLSSVRSHVTEQQN